MRTKALLTAIALSASDAHGQSSGASRLVPLLEGLTIVTAVYREDIGDYESTKSVTALTKDYVRIRMTGSEVRKTRIVRRRDLDSARRFQACFNNADDEEYPGTTAVSTSSVVLADLTTLGRADFEFQVCDEGFNKGILKRVAGPRTFNVLVNDVKTDLPVVRAEGTLEGEPASLVFLDDPSNPLVLQFRFTGRKLDVIKIAYPSDQRRIEHELATRKRAIIYGIYFDFASDAIRPESEPVLQEIADAMRRNPDWALDVGGHTDNIGGDAENQLLSERRAAAVKRALVTRHGVQTDRLTTTGYGESRPADTNETLEGRARNRRVELVRP
jgi:outer membrane protein OmpA-like peptidoglycan-associated protein